MTTNLLATILTLLVTNVSEHIEYGRVEPWLYAINPPPTPRIPPDLKHRTTEIYQQRLLILECEGVTFTNILVSKRQLLTQETFEQVAQPSVWSILSNQTVVVATNIVFLHLDGPFLTFTNATNVFLTFPNGGKD